jgi:hypothetical protein
MQRIFIKKRLVFRVESVFRVKHFTTWSINPLNEVRKSQMLPDHIALLRLRQKKQRVRVGGGYVEK